MESRVKIAAGLIPHTPSLFESFNHDLQKEGPFSQTLLIVTTFQSSLLLMCTVTVVAVNASVVLQSGYIKGTDRKGEKF